jgi:hypothetical protein
MAPRLAVPLHVIHLAGKASREPFLQMREAVGIRGGRDARQLEAERMGLLFDACLKSLPGESLEFDAAIPSNFSNSCNRPRNALFPYSRFTI